MDNHIVLIVGNGLIRSICGMHKCIPYIKRLDQIGQAFYFGKAKNENSTVHGAVFLSKNGGITKFCFSGAFDAI